MILHKCIEMLSLTQLIKIGNRIAFESFIEDYEEAEKCNVSHNWLVKNTN